MSQEKMPDMLPSEDSEAKPSSIPMLLFSASALTFGVIVAAFDVYVFRFENLRFKPHPLGQFKYEVVVVIAIVVEALIVTGFYGAFRKFSPEASKTGHPFLAIGFGVVYLLVIGLLVWIVPFVPLIPKAHLFLVTSVVVWIWLWAWPIYHVELQNNKGE